MSLVVMGGVEALDRDCAVAIITKAFTDTSIQPGEKLCVNQGLGDWESDEAAEALAGKRWQELEPSALDYVREYVMTEAAYAYYFPGLFLQRVIYPRDPSQLTKLFLATVSYENGERVWHWMESSRKLMRLLTAGQRSAVIQALLCFPQDENFKKAAEEFEKLFSEV